MLSTSKKQGALKRAMGGTIRRTVGRAAASATGTSPPPPKATGLRGALGRALSRVAPQGQKNRPPMKGNHMVRNAGPIKPETLSSTDSTLAETGDGLRQIVGRMRGRIAASKGGPITRGGPRKNDRVEGSVRYNPIFDSASSATSRKDNQRYRVRKGDEPIKELVNFDRAREEVRRGRGKGPTKRYEEGGRVGTAMSALRALARKYQEALDAGDTLLARRLKRQLDSAGFKDPEEKLGNEKTATFSKGGKVKKLAKTIRARMDDLEGYIREGFGATREEAHENLRKEVARDNGEDVVDALLKEHGVTYNRSRE